MRIHLFWWSLNIINVEVGTCKCQNMWREQCMAVKSILYKTQRWPQSCGPSLCSSSPVGHHPDPFHSWRGRMHRLPLGCLWLRSGAGPFLPQMHLPPSLKSLDQRQAQWTGCFQCCFPAECFLLGFHQSLWTLHPKQVIYAVGNYILIV